MDEATRIRLLGELIYAIQDKNRPGHDLNHLWVHFFTKRGRLVTDEVGVANAFDYLYNDVYLFNDFDLREAERLEVHTH